MKKKRFPRVQTDFDHVDTHQALHSIRARVLEQIHSLCAPGFLTEPSRQALKRQLNRQLEQLHIRGQQLMA